MRDLHAQIQRSQNLLTFIYLILFIKIQPHFLTKS